MMLCRVTGTVVSPVKKPELNPLKMLVVQPIKPDGSSDGADMLAIDYCQAGIGDRVLVAVEGDVVKQVTGSADVPANTIIMAVVDDLDITISD